MDVFFALKVFIGVVETQMTQGLSFFPSIINDVHLQFYTFREAKQVKTSLVKSFINVSFPLAYRPGMMFSIVMDTCHPHVSAVYWRDIAAFVDSIFMAFRLH